MFITQVAVGLVVSIILILILSALSDRARIAEAERTGTWVGRDKPPEGFKGYWFDGSVHQVYPMELKVSSMTAEELAGLEKD